MVPNSNLTSFGCESSPPESSQHVIQVTLPAGTQAVPVVQTASLPAGTQAVPSTMIPAVSQSANEELIRKQQQEIEMLKKSLEASQNALKEQQMALQLSQQNDVQMLLSQQLRNNQVWSLSSFKVRRELLTNDLKQVSSISLLMTSSPSKGFLS